MDSTREAHVAVKNVSLSFYIGLSLPKLGLLKFETEAKSWYVLDGIVSYLLHKNLGYVSKPRKDSAGGGQGRRQARTLQIRAGRPRALGSFSSSPTAKDAAG